MPFTAAQLLTASTKDAEKALILSRLQTLGCPITDWSVGGMERTSVELDAQRYADFDSARVPIALSAFLSTATGEWLDLVAYEVFKRTRYAATYAQGPLHLECSAAAGPYTILPNQLWAIDVTSGRRYTNTTGGTIVPGGTLDLTLKAEAAGTAYNALIGTITTLATPLPGVTITNPDCGSGVWASSLGTDAESDALLRQRCVDRWATLGYGQNADWFRYYCRNDHPYAAQVTRVAIATYPYGSGSVTVTIAGPDGPVSPEVVAAVQASITAKVGNAIGATVQSATAAPIYISGTAQVKLGFDSAYLASATAAVTALVRSLDIGQICYNSAIVEAMMTPEGVVDWTGDDTYDTYPSTTQVVTVGSVDSYVVAI